MFCVGFLCCISSVRCGICSFYFKGRCHVVLCLLWVLLSELVSLSSGSRVSFCLATSLAVYFSVSLGSPAPLVCPPELSPLSPLPSSVNKQPEPTPRRASAVNRKSQLTSPTFQPPLPPLEAVAHPQLEPQPLSPAAEAEQPGLSGAGAAGGGGGGLGGGGVQVATVQPQFVTQLSAEESR